MIKWLQLWRWPFQKHFLYGNCGDFIEILLKCVSIESIKNKRNFVEIMALQCIDGCSDYMSEWWLSIRQTASMSWRHTTHSKHHGLKRFSNGRIYQYRARLLHWYWENHIIFQCQGTQRIWENKPHQSTENDNVTMPIQFKSKLCTYSMQYSVQWCHGVWWLEKRLNSSH